MSNFSKFPRHYKLLKREIKNFNPDAVFLISLSWIRLALPLIAKGYNIYNEYHTSYYGFKIKFDQKHLFGKIKKNIWNVFIIISEKFYTNIIFLNKEEFLFYNKKNGVIIPNFYEESNCEINVKKKNQVIALGRLSYQKGFDMLIEAWDKIDNKINNWSLVIYGNGENKQQLLDTVNDLKLKNKIEINDAISNVNEKLAESQIYAMSSRYETFPMVLLESLSHGLPIVSFDCPSGPRSIILENEDGILIEPNNIEAFSEKLLFLIDNSEVRKKMSINAKKNINRFKPVHIMNIWNELIKSNIKLQN